MSYLNIKNIILLIAFFIYLILSLITLQKNSNENLSTADKILNHKHISINRLKKQFNAIEFNGHINSLKNKNIIVDTTLIALYESQNQYYLKARINFNSKEKFYIKLKCTKEIFELATKTKNNHLIVAAKIEKIEQAKINMIADLLSGSEEVLYQRNYLLFGDCFTFIEVNYI